MYTGYAYSTPDPPSGVSVSRISDSQMRVSWTDQAAYTNTHRIERWKDGSWTGVTWTDGASPSDDTGISGSDHKYKYRVRSELGSLYSSWVETGYAYSTPDPPSDLSASTASDIQIELNWTDASSYETGFKIERKTGTGGSWGQIAIVGSNTTGYSDTGLSPNTTYYYRVRAYTEHVNSGYSNTASTTTYGPPSPPSNLVASTASSTKIDLSWTDNSNNEDGFKIERKTDETSFSQIATVGANATSYPNTGLLNGERYYYRARAYNTYGNSDYSNAASATTSLPAPSGLSASSYSSSQIRLYWSNNSNNEDGFKVERKPYGGSWTQITTTTNTYYYDSGLNPNTKYYYRVRAYTEHINSGYSNTDDAATRPGAPTLNTASPGDHKVTLYWTAPSGGAAGYEVYYYRLNPFQYWLIDVGDVTNKTITGLTNGVTYYFRVRGYNQDHEAGSYSNTKSATPQGGCW